MDNPAIWSAIAASFAALSSFLVMLIQRRNLLESARPEIVLTGWDRITRGEGDTAHDVISVKMIRNVGRGAAFHVVLNSSQMHENRPTAVMSTIRLPILAAAEKEEINGEIIVWWKNVSADSSGFKSLPIRIEIRCWDARGMRHVTVYSFLAVQLSPGVGVTFEIAPGVGMAARTTSSTPVWWLRLQAKTRRLNPLRRLRSPAPRQPD